GSVARNDGFVPAATVPLAASAPVARSSRNCAMLPSSAPTYTNGTVAVGAVPPVPPVAPPVPPLPVAPVPELDDVAPAPAPDAAGDAPEPDALSSSPHASKSNAQGKRTLRRIRIMTEKVSWRTERGTRQIRTR